jgi:hypothetical protein
MVNGIRNYRKGFFVDVKSEFINKFNLKMYKNYNKKPTNQSLPKTSAPSAENIDNIDKEAAF